MENNGRGRDGRNGRDGRDTNGRNGNNRGFNTATLVQVFAIPILTGFVYLFAQWVTTGDTLKRHNEEILQNQTDIKKEGEARDKNRTEFLDKLGKLNEGIGNLNTNLAVQGEVLNSIKNEIHGANTRK